MKNFLFAIVVLTSVSYAQEGGIITQPGTIPVIRGTESDTQAIPRLDSQPASGSILVIVCDSKPEKLLVLDSSGKWIPAVQSVELKLEIGRTTPKAVCTLWSGPIKPTNPEVKTWDLSQLKSVGAAEFDKMIDSVQTDPDAIKKMLTK